MKKFVYGMSIVTMVVMMSIFCSCGNGNKNQENSIDEVVASDSIPDKETNVNEMNSTIPSVQEIGVLFTDMEKGKSSALKDYGFTLEDKQSKKVEDEYGDEEITYMVNKETYSLKYKLYDSDGYMKVTYVSAKDFGEPSMSIICDEESWEQLKREAESSLKLLVDNFYYLSISSFISFPRKGQIKITTENSITWD